MNKLIVVTGGSSGIGKSILEFFETKNYNAVSWDLTPSENSIVCDVSNQDSVQNAYNQTLEKFGTPDVLVNNAGLQFMSPVEDFPLEKWDLVTGVILKGTFLCSRAVIPAMKLKKSGRIINISSIHGKVASPYKAAYVAAKHGVLGLSKVMAQELGEFGITVNSICPGFVDTPLLQKQIQKQAELNHISLEAVQNDIMLKPQVIKNFTSPQQISELAYFLSSPAASTITGEAYNMAGGWGMGT